MRNGGEMVRHGAWPPSLHHPRHLRSRRAERFAEEQAKRAAREGRKSQSRQKAVESGQAKNHTVLSCSDSWFQPWLWTLGVMKNQRALTRTPCRRPATPHTRRSSSKQNTSAAESSDDQVHSAHAVFAIRIKAPKVLADSSPTVFATGRSTC